MLQVQFIPDATATGMVEGLALTKHCFPLPYTGSAGPALARSRFLPEASPSTSVRAAFRVAGTGSVALQFPSNEKQVSPVWRARAIPHQQRSAAMTWLTRPW